MVQEKKSVQDLETKKETEKKIGKMEKRRKKKTHRGQKWVGWDKRVS